MSELTPFNQLNAASNRREDGTWRTPMTERTYGPFGHSLQAIEQSNAACVSSQIAHSMAAHIRELQAENAKLKAEQREFGMRIAAIVAQKFNHGSPVHEIHFSAIVEQELNK